MRRGGSAPLLTGVLAVAAGNGFLWDAGALPGMATRNAIAFALGLPLGWAAHKIAHIRHGAAILFALATAVLALVLVNGAAVEGVKRWLVVGPLQLQPALFFAPLILAIVASREGRHWRVAILLPLLLIAFQPDAATLVAMAGGTAAVLAAASMESTRGWTTRRLAIAGLTCFVAVAALVAAGIRTPPPVAFVEGTIGIAQVSGLAAIALHAAASGLAIAALASGGGAAGAALATYIALATLAAAFWAFPMPIAGAGPSHLVGFGLAIGWLAERQRTSVRLHGDSHADL